MMTASNVEGSATMYCQVPVLVSKTSWMMGWVCVEALMLHDEEDSGLARPGDRLETDVV